MSVCFSFSAGSLGVLPRTPFFLLYILFLNEDIHSKDLTVINLSVRAKAMPLAPDQEHPNAYKTSPPVSPELLKYK